MGCFANFPFLQQKTNGLFLEAPTKELNEQAQRLRPSSSSSSTSHPPPVPEFISTKCCPQHARCRFHEHLAMEVTLTNSLVIHSPELLGKSLSIALASLAPDDDNAVENATADMTISSLEPSSSLPRRERNFLSSHAVQAFLFPETTTKPTPLDRFVGPVRHDLRGDKCGGRVGDFDIVGPLGKGTFGVVLEGRTTNSAQWWSVKQDRVAIKTLEKKRCCRSPARTKLTLNEMKMHKLLMGTASGEHANLVHVRDMMQSHTHVYVVMNMGACDLNQYTNTTRKRNFLHQSRADKEICKGVLRGLETMHSYFKAAHMDVKMENVLIKRNVHPGNLTADDVALCDFGLTQFSPDASGFVPVDGICGTSGYIPPEMLLHKSTYDGRTADMWAAGVMMTAMKVGLPHDWKAAHAMAQDGVPAKTTTKILKNCYASMRSPEYWSHNDAEEMGQFVADALLVWTQRDRWTPSRALQHQWLVVH